MSTNVGTINLDLELQSKGFQSQVNRAAQSATKSLNSVGSGANGLTSAFKRLGAAVAGAFALEKIVSFGKQCIELGSDLAEVQNVVDVTFPTMSAQVDKFAQSAMATFGLSETMTKKFTGTFGSMAEAFGFTEKEAYDMSTTLTGLAGDVASFYNITQEEAYTKLKSVFSGETETLKDLGIVMTQSALDAYALANGFGATTQSMSEQEKVALRYAFVQSQLTNATGDFFRTQDSWANQSRILSLQAQSAMAAVGQGLINIFKPVLVWINTIMAKIVSLANAFRDLTATFFGDASGGSGGGIGTALSSANDSASQLSTNIGNASGAASSLGDGLKAAKKAVSNLGGDTKAAGDRLGKATKAAKALRRQLEGFDQIIRVEAKNSDGSKSGTESGANPNGTAGTGSGAGAAGSTGVDMGSAAESVAATGTAADTARKKLTKLQKLLTRYMKMFVAGFRSAVGNTVKNIKKVKENLASIKQSLLEIFSSRKVQSAANRLVGNIAYYFGQMAGSAANVASAIVDNLTAGLARSLDAKKEFIQQKLASIFTIQADLIQLQGNFLEAIARVVSDALTSEPAERITAAIFSTLSTALLSAWELLENIALDAYHIIADPFIRNSGKISTAIEGTLEPIATVLEGFEETVSSAFESIGDLYDKHLHPFFEAIADGFSDTFGVWLDVYNEKVAPMLQRLSEAVKQMLEEHLQPAFEKICGLIGAVVDALKSAYENQLKPIITWVIKYIVPILLPIVEKIASIVIDKVGMIIDAIGGIADVLHGIIDFFTGVFSGDWDKAWSGLKLIVTTVFGGIKSNISTALNKIKSTVTKIWDGIKSTTSTIWNSIKTTITSVVNSIKSKVLSVFNSMKSTVSNIWNSIKSTASSVWNGVKSAIINVVNGIKDKVSSVFNSVKSKVSTVWNNIKNSIVKPIESARDKVKSVVDKIKGFFTNLKLKIPTPSLPRMPSFELKWDTKNILGKKISYPTGFGVKWHAKAMNNPVLLTRPTIFGAAGNNLLAGGEAGTEVVSGARKLMSMITESVRKATGSTKTTVELSGFATRNTPRLSAVGSRSEKSLESQLAQMKSSVAADKADRAKLEALLRDILEFLRDMDIVRLDPETLRKYFIVKTNANTRANGGKSELVL